VLACLVVLVLAVGGLLLWRGATARPGGAAEAGASHGTLMSARRRKTSRDAVRRSQIHASRAPCPVQDGLLCERASEFSSRCADRLRLKWRALRLIRSPVRTPDFARFPPARC
jgi:hypothetical protein